MSTLEYLIAKGKNVIRSFNFKDYKMPNVKEIAIRLAGVFLASAIPNVGVGAMVDVTVWKAALMSGGMAVLAVVQQLAVAIRADGKITDSEMDEIFNDEL